MLYQLLCRRRFSCLQSFVIAGLLGLAAPAAEAQFFVSESFNYGVGNYLAGANGGSGDWNGSWSALSGTTISDNNLEYVGGNIHVGGDGKSVRIANTNVSAILSRPFAQQQANSTYYFSFLFRTEGTLDGSDFLHFMLNDDLNNDNSAGIGDLDSGAARFSHRIGGSIGGSTGAEPAELYEADRTYLLVGKVENANLTNTVTQPNEENEPDRITLWVNPTTFDELSPGTTWTGSQGNLGASFSTYEFFTVRGANLDASDLYFFDELRIGTTWGQVVPEPGSAMLIGLAAAGLLLRRKSAR